MTTLEDYRREALKMTGEFTKAELAERCREKFGFGSLDGQRPHNAIISLIKIGKVERVGEATDGRVPGRYRVTG